MARGDLWRIRQALIARGMAYFAVPAFNQVIAGCRLSVSSRFMWGLILFCGLIVVYILDVSWVFGKVSSAERVSIRDLCVVI